MSSSESSDDESPESDSSDDELPGVFTGECGDGQYLKGDVRGRGVDTKMSDVK